MAELTVIFNTLNDNYEARMTTKSILETAGDKVDIIAVDDHSDSPFVFEEKPKNLRIIRTRERIGVGPTRHVGVYAAQTEYVLIIDSHMRFKPGWLEAAMERLPGRPKTIHCATCLGLDQHQNMDINHPRGAYHGARMNIFGPDPNKPAETQIFEGVWEKDRPGEDDYEIGCVMGACYFMRKQWFQHIGGLKYLRMWGSDEPYISMKTWMAGGECRIIKTVQIGHKFRTDQEQPFKTQYWNLIWNKMFALKTLFSTEEATFLTKRIPHSVERKRAAEVLAMDSRIIEGEFHYNQSIFTRDLRWYCDKFGLPYPLT